MKAFGDENGIWPSERFDLRLLLDYNFVCSAAVFRRSAAGSCCADSKEYAKEIGYEKAVEIAKEAIKKDAILSGKMLADKFSGNSLSELSTIAKEVWAKDNAMSIRIIKETEMEFFFDVTECGYAKMYEKLGLRDLGCILSCDRDFSF